MALRTLENAGVRCIVYGRVAMDAGVGWVAAIIIGGIAGWLAEQFMKSDMGLLMNIVLGDLDRAVGKGDTPSLRTDSGAPWSGRRSNGHEAPRVHRAARRRGCCVA